MVPEHLSDELLLLFVDSLLTKGAVASLQRESHVFVHSLDEFGCWVLAGGWATHHALRIVLGVLLFLGPR